MNKETLQEFLRDNPDKGLNDYYVKHPNEEKTVNEKINSYEKADVGLAEVIRSKDSSIRGGIVSLAVTIIIFSLCQLLSLVLTIENPKTIVTFQVIGFAVLIAGSFTAIAKIR
jgi:hypothetical protein